MTDDVVPPAAAASDPPSSDLARSLYTALAAGDRDTLDVLLHPDFDGVLADGLPFGLGGSHRGARAMRRDGWGGIAKHFRARAEPERFLGLADGRLLVTGRYTGAGLGGSPLDAAFAHVLTIQDGRIRALVQYTDTARWAEAASPLRTVTLEVSGGIATARLDRPAAANAIDQAMARDLLEVVTRVAEDPAARVLLLAGDGPMFTAGGDIGVFAAAAPERLPALLHRMIDDYHRAIERLTALDTPVVAAVRGAAAGGGLGMVCAADVVVAAEDAVFTVGYGALGLTADGGTTWFLPRLVGMRRAQEMFLLNRRLTATEALELGLVTRIVPAGRVDAEATSIAGRLAAGPTRALGGIRRLLRQSFETGLAAQLADEKASIADVAGSADAHEGIQAFTERREPRFSGR